jgi:putative transposase
MELTDKQWQAVQALMTKEYVETNAAAKGGRPRANDRLVLSGILWIMKTGEQWAHLPKKYGAHVTVWRRYKEWEGSGLWGKIWGVLLPTLDRKTQLEWVLAFLDGNFVPGKRA